MSRLVVTPYSALSEMLESHQPSHLVSLLSPRQMEALPDGFSGGFGGQHLRLELDDVAEEAPGRIVPSASQMQSLITFARGWEARAPMLLHCWAGVSRSMAAAMAILCDRLGVDSEINVARAMRRRAPFARPNVLMVRHADDVLGRGGRLNAALNTMGNALPAAEGSATSFPLENL